eukprot:366421-Chlamydomonas_euryale.AAC.13
MHKREATCTSGKQRAQAGNNLHKRETTCALALKSGPFSPPHHIPHLPFPPARPSPVQAADGTYIDADDFDEDDEPPTDSEDSDSDEVWGPKECGVGSVGAWECGSVP